MLTCQWLTGMSVYGDPIECRDKSRYHVARSDSEPGYEPMESCPRHLPDVLPALLAGHEGVQAIVTVHWDGAGEDGRED